MNFKSQTMKRAWAIRKLAAVKYGCHCNQISWKECLQMAVAEETTLLLGWEGYEMETFHFETTRAAGKFANGYHTLFATGIVEGETLTIFCDYGFNIPWFTVGIQEVKPFANSQNLRARLVKKFKLNSVNRDDFIRAGYVYFTADCGYFTVDSQGEKIPLDELTAKELAIDVAIAHSDELVKNGRERAKNVVPYPVLR